MKPFRIQAQSETHRDDAALKTDPDQMDVGENVDSNQFETPPKAVGYQLDCSNRTSNRGCEELSESEPDQNGPRLSACDSGLKLL